MIIIQSHSNSPGFNLSTEEYLFSGRHDEILFLYVNEPCVVIGRNQDLFCEVNTPFCLENNIPVFRRISGGGSVFQDTGNLNYCFISNRVQGNSSLNADFLRPIVTVLNDLQVEVQTGKRKDLWLPGGHKISGTASHVGKSRELHHGTLLYDSNLDTLEKSLSPKVIKQESRKIASVHSPVENIRTYLKAKKYNAPETDLFLKLFTEELLSLYSLDSVSELSTEELSGIIPLLPVLNSLN